MSVFIYSAKNKKGRQVNGTLHAGSMNGAQSELKRKNLTVMSIKQAEKETFIHMLSKPPEKASTKEVVLMTRQVATMLSAGIPLIEALEIVEDQMENRGFKIVLGNIVENVRSGSDLSTSLGMYPKIFGKIYINMIMAGEAGGQLDVILIRLSEFLEAQQELKQRIKSAMTYPIISLVLIISITVGLIVFIIPQFKDIFTSMGMEDLPLPTAILLAVSDAFIYNYITVTIVLAIIIAAIVAYGKTDRGEKHFDWILLHLPVFGVLFQKVAIARFARTFATLISSGVPILGALEIVAGTSGNRILEDAILYAKSRVSEGEPLGEPLESTKVFPSMVTKMISIGERSGALEQLLIKIGEFYDAEVKAMVDSLTSLIEPILIVIMGLVVGTVVLAIFLPIIGMQTKLTNA